MAQGSRNKARQAAVQALYQWQLTGQAASDIESHFISDRNLEGTDAEYFRLLVREVPAELEALDALLVPYVDRTLAEVDPVERAILRLAAYELQHRLEIPYRVILNEAIELAKIFGAEHGHRYVNGVLDKLATQLRASEAPAP